MDDKLRPVDAALRNAESAVSDATFFLSDRGGWRDPGKARAAILRAQAQLETALEELDKASTPQAAPVPEEHDVACCDCLDCENRRAAEASHAEP